MPENLTPHKPGINNSLAVLIDLTLLTAEETFPKKEVLVIFPAEGNNDEEVCRR
jgi:hypothetical protein